jgi:VanZ family protein
MPEFSKESRKKINIITAITWTFVLFLMSFAPVSNLETPRFLNFSHSDKLIHFILYFFTGAIWIFVLDSIFKSKRKIFVWMSIVLPLCFLTEFGQLIFFPYRSFEFSDIVANIVGSFAGLIFVEKLKAIKLP